jgi:predicted O-methyltransferase YrrM
MRLFSKEERVTVPISSIGRPEDRNLYGDDNWGGSTYYADWCGIARKYKPYRVLELGVHLGYGAMALIAGSGCQFYTGVDDEREVAGSNDLARANLKSQSFWTVNDTIIEATVGLDPPDLRLAEVIRRGPFDLVAVDSDHTICGTLAQLHLAWATLAPGGIIVIDDFRSVEVREGWERFLLELGEAVTVQHYENERNWLIVRRAS